MDMKPQSQWRWEHAIYFFLGGLGAAAYVVGVLGDFAGEDWKPLAKFGFFIAFPCCAAGAGLLLIDLGKMANFMHAWKRPGTSWIARGTIIISLFIFVSFVTLALWITPVTGGLAAVRSLLEVIGLVLAFGVMIYPGFLLGTNRPVAFWSTSMLPAAFLSTALYTGVMGLLLVGAFAAPDAVAGLRVLDKYSIVLILVQLFILLFYVGGAHRVPASRASADLLLTGAHANLFWFGVIAVGMVVPLGLQMINILSNPDGGGGILAVFAALAGLVGSLLLRQTILVSGIHAPLKAGRFEFVLPPV